MSNAQRPTACPERKSNGSNAELMLYIAARNFYWTGRCCESVENLFDLSAPFLRPILENADRCGLGPRVDRVAALPE